MPPTNRRPREVDTSQHCCPPADCDDRGWLGLGNLRATGHPRGGPWRPWHGPACPGAFPEHHGTIVHGKQVAVALIVHGLACWAEGLGMRATARVFEVAPNTVLHWWMEAAEPLRALSATVRCDVHVEQGHRDTLAVLSAVKDGAMREAAASTRRSRSPHWVGVAIDPVTTLVRTIAVGERPVARAPCLVHHVALRFAPDGVPLFLREGLTDDAPAILTHGGHGVQPARRHGKGPRPTPRWMPRPELLDAQGGKTVRRRRLVEGKHRVVFGTKVVVEQGLAACGWQINPACIERITLSMRQHGAAVGRRVAPRCTGAAG